MDRTYEAAEDVIDLGAASVETKGAVGGSGDVIGLLPENGLSDD